MPNPVEVEEKLPTPLALERQPFSNILFFARGNNNYANPLEKVDLKAPFRQDKYENTFNPVKFANRNFAEMCSSLDIEEDENIPI